MVSEYFDRFEDKELIQELLSGMYTELPTPKKKKWIIIYEVRIVNGYYKSR